MTALALTVLRDLLLHLDHALHVVVFIDPEVDPKHVEALARAYGAWDDRRVRVVAARSATAYSQDNARAAVDRHGFPALLVSRGFRPELGRDEDAIPADEIGRALGVRVVRSRSYWEGGNILHDSEHCVVGADTIADNRLRLGLTDPEARRLLEADLGTTIHVIGDASRARFDFEHDTIAPSGQASFHIDLDVSILGRVGRRAGPVALVADAEQGARLVEHVLRDRATLGRHLIPAARVRELLTKEFEAAAEERRAVLADYRATLRQIGYRIVGVPDVRVRRANGLFGDSRLDFTYCNVLPGLNAGRPSVHYLPWGIPALDRAAEAQYRAAGVQPVRVSSDPIVADALMRLSAGLHCFCGPLP